MNAQIARIKAWYGTLQERERRVVSVGAVLVALIILIAGILLPLQSAVSGAMHRADVKRADLAWMQINAPEVQFAGANVLQRPSTEPAVVIVDRTGRDSGLAASLRGTQPSGNGVRVQLEAAPFDTLITWLAALDQRYGLGVDSITVDRAAKPGVVNANVTFTAPRR